MVSSKIYSVAILRDSAVVASRENVRKLLRARPTGARRTRPARAANNYFGVRLARTSSILKQKVRDAKNGCFGRGSSLLRVDPL